MADTRLFRLTYDRGTVKHGNRLAAGLAAAMTAKRGGNCRLGYVVKVEATNWGANEGWRDVSAEFGIGA